MRKLVLSFLIAGIAVNTGSAQTLFSYGNGTVTRQEFLRNYQKNALNKQPDFSEAALREYVDLYSLFRMKVREAEQMHLDTLPSIQRELDNYRKQLARTYLTDEEVTNKMIREAYERMKEERRVAHILLMAPPGLNAEDTTRIYQRIDSIYTALTKKKADFGKLAALYSEDRGTKDKGGDIGYMTALQTLYPFENMAYETKKGEVSRPFRSALGYHILKVVDTRPARGQVQVAHILVETPESRGEAGIKAAHLKMDTVMAELKRGKDWEDLVKRFSDDRFTNTEGGVLPEFGVGRMVPEFEDAAFQLNQPGDISPVVKTQFGLHILKLIRKESLKPYDSLKVQLKRQIESDSRAQMARQIYFDKIKAKHGFKEYHQALDEVANRLAAIPDTGKEANTFVASDFSDMNATLFELGGNKYTQSDLVSFAEGITRGRLVGPKQGVVKDLYKMYVDRVINDFQEQRLMVENEDFKNLMQEYRDGIMLFELMDKNVWTKASRDTVGLKNFYEANKSKYQWEPGFRGLVYRFRDEDALKEGLKLMNQKKALSTEELLQEMNKDGKSGALSVQEGMFEFSRFTDVPREQLVKGKRSSAVKKEDGSYVMVKVNEVYNDKSQKTLDEARGYVVAEYQDHLEKKWNEELRSKYPVKVEDGVLKALVK